MTILLKHLKRIYYLIINRNPMEYALDLRICRLRFKAGLHTKCRIYELQLSRILFNIRDGFR